MTATPTSPLLFFFVNTMARVKKGAPPHLADTSSAPRTTRSTVGGKAPRIQLPTVGPMSNPPPPPENKDDKTAGESPPDNPGGDEEQKESEEESEEEDSADDGEDNSEEAGSEDGSDEEEEETVVAKVRFLVGVVVVVIMLLLHNFKHLICNHSIGPVTEQINYEAGSSTRDNFPF